MNLIDELFKRYKLSNEKSLIKYGFQKTNENTYFYQTNIDEESFSISLKLTILNDLSYKFNLTFFEDNEEYPLTNFILNNFTQTTLSDFNLQVLQKITTFLLDLRDFAFIKVEFNNEIANKVSDYIKEVYGASAEFPFKNDPTYAVFRNKENNKWFAMIMDVPFSKIDRINHSKDNSTQYILNVKADSTKIPTLIDTYDYIFKGYHMNSKTWISILLLDNNEILKHIYLLLKDSYTLIENSEKPKKYIRKK